MRLWEDPEFDDEGLRRAYDVYKPRDGRPHSSISGEVVYPDDKRIGADGEFIFVLRPESDLAAWLALRDYAQRVQYPAPQLAADIRAELHRIRVVNDVD